MHSPMQVRTATLARPSGPPSAPPWRAPWRAPQRRPQRRPGAPPGAPLSAALSAALARPLARPSAPRPAPPLAPPLARPHSEPEKTLSTLVEKNLFASPRHLQEAAAGMMRIGTVPLHTAKTKRNDAVCFLTRALGRDLLVL